MTRLFRFAVGAPAGLAERRQLVEHVMFAEQAGFDVATFPDHFFIPFAPLIASAVAAQVTSRLKVGTLMLAATFRNPALLAKELATLDVLTEGRLEVGLGAGWMESEHAAAGLHFGGPRERIARAAEVATILKAAWASERLSFAGKHYTISDLPSTPEVVHVGGPPLMMGGGGRVVLSAAAEVADVVTIAAGAIGVAGEPARSHRSRLAERVGWVREAAHRCGRSPELHILLSDVAVCNDRYEGARRCMESMRQGHPFPDDRGDDEQSILDSPYFAVGAVTEICDQLRTMREELGISYVSVREHFAREFAPVVAELAGT